MLGQQQAGLHPARPEHPPGVAGRPVDVLDRGDAPRRSRRRSACRSPGGSARPAPRSRSASRARQRSSRVLRPSKPSPAHQAAASRARATAARDRGVVGDRHAAGLRAGGRIGGDQHAVLDHGHARGTRRRHEREPSFAAQSLVRLSCEPSPKSPAPPGRDRARAADRRAGPQGRRGRAAVAGRRVDGPVHLRRGGGQDVPLPRLHAGDPARASRTWWPGRSTGAATRATGGTGTPAAGGPATGARPGVERSPQRPPIRLTAVHGTGHPRWKTGREQPDPRQLDPPRPARGHRAAHRRRPDPGRRAGAARRPRPGRHAGLPAPAAHPRRHDGQPRLPQGRLAAARAGRPRGAALQHPGHEQRAGHQRGRVRRRRSTSGTTSPPRSSTRSSPTCRTSGCSAGRSAPTWP